MKENQDMCKCGHYKEMHSEHGCDGQVMRNKFLGKMVDCSCQKFEPADMCKPKIVVLCGFQGEILNG